MRQADDRTIPDLRPSPHRRRGERRRQVERRVFADPRAPGSPRDDTVTGTISVRSRDDRVVITPDGAFAYVQHAEDGTISIIRTVDNTVLVTLGSDGTLVAPVPSGSVSAESARLVAGGDGGPAAQTPVEEIGDHIRRLVAAGVLRSAWATAFLTKLDATTEQLRAGRSGPIKKFLQAFRRQLAQFLSAGILTAAAAEPLRLAVEGAISELGG